MPLPTNDDLQTLLRNNAAACVSLYLPTERAGAPTRENRIRFKNLLNEAEEQMAAAGIRAADARDMLAPVRPLINDDPVWKRQAEGLALFATSDGFQRFNLPLACDKAIVVADHFHIKPLLPVLAGDGRFYILALSLGKVRLLRGTRYRIEELKPEGLPKSLADALWYLDTERSDQWHTRAQARPRGGETLLPGHGAADDEQKAHLREYFRAVDEGFRELAHAQPVPLVLAGTERLLAAYREVNSHPCVAGEAIPGNPDDLSLKELHARAWGIVRPHFLKPQREAAARYPEAFAHQRGSANLKDVLAAAHEGRIQTLFVDAARPIWGRYDRTSGEVETHEKQAPADVDLLNLAARHVLLNGGEVYAVTGDELPAEPLAGIYRY